MTSFHHQQAQASAAVRPHPSASRRSSSTNSSTSRLSPHNVRSALQHVGSRHTDLITRVGKQHRVSRHRGQRHHLAATITTIDRLLTVSCKLAIIIIITKSQMSHLRDIFEDFGSTNLLISTAFFVRFVFANIPMASFFFEHAHHHQMGTSTSPAGATNRQPSHHGRGNRFSIRSPTFFSSPRHPHHPPQSTLSRRHRTPGPFSTSIT